jgi:hypothetical protein
MPAITISKRSVDSSRPGTRDAFLWDNQIRGFGLKITQAAAGDTLHPAHRPFDRLLEQIRDSGQRTRDHSDLARRTERP